MVFVDVEGRRSKHYTDEMIQHSIPLAEEEEIIDIIKQYVQAIRVS